MIREAACHDANRITNNGEGTYDMVMKTAERLQRHGVAYNILCVVNAANVKDGGGLYRFLTGKGFSYLQFIPCLAAFGEEDSPHAISAKEYGLFLRDVFALYYEDFRKGNYVSIRLFVCCKDRAFTTDEHKNGREKSVT